MKAENWKQLKCPWVDDRFTNYDTSRNTADTWERMVWIWDCLQHRLEQTLSKRCRTMHIISFGYKLKRRIHVCMFYMHIMFLKNRWKIKPSSSGCLSWSEDTRHHGWEKETPLFSVPLGIMNTIATMLPFKVICKKVRYIFNKLK